MTISYFILGIVVGVIVNYFCRGFEYWRRLVIYERRQINVCQWAWVTLFIEYVELACREYDIGNVKGARQYLEDSLIEVDKLATRPISAFLEDVNILGVALRLEVVISKYLVSVCKKELMANDYFKEIRKLLRDLKKMCPELSLNVYHDLVYKELQPTILADDPL